LSEALVRVRERLGRGERSASPEVIAGAMTAVKPLEGHAHRVLVRDGPRVHVIPVDKIDYVQAQDDYVCFRSEGKDYLKEQTLAEVEASLDPKAFVRIHRSYLLNLARLVRVDQDERENRVAVLTDGRRLPVSRAGYTRLNSLL
jgi:two-component system LytT family response regulator